MNGCSTCFDNAERAYEAVLRADAALRCCESGHRPAYRRGRLAGQQRVERACQLAYANGARKGAVRALFAVFGLLVGAVVLGRRT